MSVPPQSSSMPPRGDYWAESRRPLASLIFIAPLLLTYEAGVLLLGRNDTANGADVWLRQFLAWIGFRQYFLLPVLTVCILLAWHYVTRQPWRVSRGIFHGMTGECVLLSLCLWLVLQLQGLLFQGLFSPALAWGPKLSLSSGLARLVGYLGAGVYEELLFRLILLSLVLGGLRGMRFTPRSSMVLAVLATSLLFAGAHYIGPGGDDFRWFSFVFRCLAGIFFSLLFVYRGFGIAAGTHAGYDLLIGLWALWHAMEK